tara:strand:- start:44816 stop:45901 length:1086 start_codon:yes stop_codon:yes gene_type:complete
MWAKTFGGINYEISSTLQITSDNGFIIIGRTNSYGVNTDVWLIKTDNMGNEEWSKTFGGNHSDVGYAVQETSDGGFILTGGYGRKGRFDGNSYTWLIKTDNKGNEEWNKKFGGNYYDSGQGVLQTDDGGFIILGTQQIVKYGYSNIWLIKTDSEGNLEWDKLFNGHGSEVIQQTRDGGFIIIGRDDYDILLIKTDNKGNEEWNKKFGGSGIDFGYSVQQTTDDGFIIIGDTQSFGNGNNLKKDIWLIKTDNKGNKEWSKTFGGIDNEFSGSVLQTIDGGFILIGTTHSFGNIFGAVWLIKTDNKGHEEWNKKFGGNSDGNSVLQTDDGGYIIVGDTQSFGNGFSDILLIKTDSKGNSQLLE